MECDKEMYRLVCEKQFDKIEQLQTQTLELLRGKNGSPGLVDDVRGLKKVYTMLVGAVVFLVSVLLIQAVTWLRTTYFS